MADFLRQNYNESVVAANDIGAITFFTDIHLFDMAGLGSSEAAAEIVQYGGLCKDERMKKYFEESAAKRGVELAIVYDIWFEGCIPANWERVGQWTISHNVACGDPSISFYAVTENKRESLINNLRNFSFRLHRNVQEDGRYLEQETKNKF